MKGRVTVLAMAMAGAAACSGGPDDAPAPGPTSDDAVSACPTDGDDVVVEAFSGLSGSYALTVESNDGLVARGNLTLQPVPAADSGAPSVPGTEEAASGRALSWGWTDLDAAAAGAFAPGNLDSRDADRPGVLLLVSPTTGGESAVLLRLGSQVNDRSRTDFDGGHFALRVLWTRPDSSFGGSWTSRGGGRRASGTFCANQETP